MIHEAFIFEDRHYIRDEVSPKLEQKWIQGFLIGDVKNI